MIKLEEICGYLPYKLKVFWNKKVLEMTAEIKSGYTYSIIGVIEDEDVKPILRPLSDLTKPITVEGYNRNNP